MVAVSTPENPVVTEVVLTNFGIVVVFDPIDLVGIDQLWLVKNAILDENSPLSEASFSPQIVSVGSGKFDLVILPDRIQLLVQIESWEDAPAILKRTIGGFQNARPETQFKAIGFNFGAILPNGDGRDLGAFSRERFAPTLVIGKPFFKENKVLFGSVFRFSKFEFLVQCQVDPRTFRMSEDSPDKSEDLLKNNTDAMFAAVNFHRDLVPGDNVLDFVSRWSDAASFTKEFLNEVS